VTASVYEALADPTRRRLLDLLRDRERTAGELAADFAVSRPAVSRHLRVLRESGLVRWRGEAQRRVYMLDPAPLATLDEWLEPFRDVWAEHLDRLEQHLEHARTDPHGR
jgi:DNA-binding transcriptional ArsR family regulator